MKTRTNHGSMIDLENDPSEQIESPRSILKKYLETLAIGDHRIDDIARAIGMKDQIVNVARLLRTFEGRGFGEKEFSSRCAGRRRLFTVSPKVENIIMPTIIIGTQVLFGLVEKKPLEGFPAGETFIDMHPEEFLRVYVGRGADRRGFYVAEEAGKWIPKIEIDLVGELTKTNIS